MRKMTLIVALACLTFSYVATCKFFLVKRYRISGVACFLSEGSCTRMLMGRIFP